MARIGRIGYPSDERYMRKSFRNLDRDLLSLGLNTSECISRVKSHKVRLTQLPRKGQLLGRSINKYLSEFTQCQELFELPPARVKGLIAYSRC